MDLINGRNFFSSTKLSNIVFKKINMQFIFFYKFKINLLCYL